MQPTRRQLTLFIQPPDHVVIEQVRRQFNPVQQALIPAHVTLCREDEIEPLDRVLANLESLRFGPVAIRFGPVCRFSEGKGVLIPALPDNEAFQQLRIAVLKGVVDQPRRHEPHITMMHPRNSTCTDADFEQISGFVFPEYITFETVCLIEQELGQEWRVLRRFELW